MAHIIKRNHRTENLVVFNDDDDIVDFGSFNQFDTSGEPVSHRPVSRVDCSMVAVLLAMACVAAVVVLFFFLPRTHRPTPVPVPTPSSGCTYGPWGPWDPVCTFDYSTSTSYQTWNQTSSGNNAAACPTIIENSPCSCSNSCQLIQVNTTQPYSCRYDTNGLCTSMTYSVLTDSYCANTNPLVFDPLCGRALALFNSPCNSSCADHTPTPTPTPVFVPTPTDMPVPTPTDTPVPTLSAGCIYGAWGPWDPICTFDYSTNTSYQTRNQTSSGSTAAVCPPLIENSPCSCLNNCQLTQVNTTQSYLCNYDAFGYCVTITNSVFSNSYCANTNPMIFDSLCGRALALFDSPCNSSCPNTTPAPVAVFSPTPIPSCDDGNACTIDGVYTNGTCPQKILVDCNYLATNPCYIPYCDTTGGCLTRAKCFDPITGTTNKCTIAGLCVVIAAAKPL